MGGLDTGNGNERGNKMKVITSCMRCRARYSCEVWMKQLTTDEKIAHYGEGIIHPNCPLEDASPPPDLKLIEEVNRAGYDRGIKFSDERWREKIQAEIDKITDHPYISDAWLEVFDGLLKRLLEDKP